MKPTLTFTRDTKKVKKPHLSGKWRVPNLRTQAIKISPMQFERNNTEITVTLPKNYHGYFTSKFRSGVIETINGNQQRI